MQFDEVAAFFTNGRTSKRSYPAEKLFELYATALSFFDPPDGQAASNSSSSSSGCLRYDPTVLGWSEQQRFSKMEALLLYGDPRYIQAGTTFNSRRMQQSVGKCLQLVTQRVRTDGCGLLALAFCFSLASSVNKVVKAGGCCHVLSY